MWWYAYILKCIDGTYYAGCTNNLEEHMNQHSRGLIHYTKSRLPYELVTCISFKEKHKAFGFERYLKSGSGIAFRNKSLV